MGLALVPFVQKVLFSTDWERVSKCLWKIISPGFQRAGWFSDVSY
jgi:hypothetical protein